MGKTKSAKTKVAKKTAKASPKAKAKAPSKKTLKATPQTKVKAASKIAKTQGSKTKVTSKVTSKVVKTKATVMPAKSGKKVASKTTSQKTKAATETVNPKLSSKTQSPKLDQIKLKPLQNRILVELVTAEKTTPGGLIIPETAQVSGNFKGTVLAVGSGIFSKKGKHRPMEVKPGDKVLFAEWSGDKIEMNGKTLHILRESDVLGLVD